MTIIPPEDQAYLVVSYSDEDMDRSPEDSNFAYTTKDVKASKGDENLWHRRLMHLNPNDVMRMYKKGMVEGMEIIRSKGKPSPNICAPCQKGKQTRSEIPKQTQTRATEVLERVFSDVCETSVPSRQGHRYFVTFTDDASRYTHVDFITKKSDTIKSLKSVVALMENETGRKLRKTANGWRR